MILTLDQLLEITASEDFNDVPLKAAQACAETSWWKRHEAMTEAAAQLCIWQTAAYVALLFDTYGDHIQSVSMRWSIVEDGDKHYSNLYLEINGERCDVDTSELPDDTQEAIETIDDGQVMGRAISAFDDAMPPHVLSRFETIRDALGGTIGSADQARRIISQHAPQVAAMMELARMERDTPAASGRRTGPGAGRL